MGDGITHSRPKPNKQSEIERIEIDYEFVTLLVDQIIKLNAELKRNGPSHLVEYTMKTINGTLESYLKPHYVIRGE